jgi:hypothetical protein
MQKRSPDTPTPDWIEELPCAVTVCDLRGVVLQMNERAAAQYEKYGGKKLLGMTLVDCHPEPARGKLLQLLESGKSNTYTIERDGIRKLIHQSPWYSEGKRGGIVEWAFEIPFDLPSFMR